MDGNRFDELARKLVAPGANSRRSILRLLTGVGLGGALALRGREEAAAQCTPDGSPCIDGGECCSGRCPRHPGSRRKVCRAAPEEGTCKPNGTACREASDCCSGRCVRKRGKRTRECRRAPGQGTCTIERDSCSGTVFSCGPEDRCFCRVTARGQSFCSDPYALCTACSTDGDCVELFNEPGARCAWCEECEETGGRLCALPCSQ